MYSMYSLIPVLIGLAAGIALIALLGIFFGLKGVGINTIFEHSPKQVAVSRGDNSTAVYQTDSSELVNSQNIPDYPSFRILRNYSLGQMIDLDKRFCGAVSYEIQQYVNNKTNQTTFSNYLPQRVIFSHLQTTEPLLRVSCGFSPSGQYYAHYYVANNSKLIALSEIPLIIHNNAEAKEFVLYFTYGSGSGIYPLLSKDSYDGFTEKCNLTLEPPLKGIGIEKSEDSNSFIVQITIDDGNSGTIEYQKLSVEALEHDYKADVKENIVIGQCGPVI